MKATLVLLLIVSIAAGCSMNAYESYENYLPEVRLVEAEEGGFHIEWDENRSASPAPSQSKGRATEMTDTKPGRTTTSLLMK